MPKIKLHLVLICSFVFFVQSCIYFSKKNDCESIDFNTKLVQWDSIYEQSPSQKGDILLEKYKKSAICLNDKKNLANVYRRMGNQYVLIGEYKTGIDTLIKSLKLSEEVQDSFGIASTLNNIGLIYDKQGHYLQGLPYHLQAFKMYQSLRYTYGSADVAMVLANSYSALNKNDTALLFASKAIALKQKTKGTGINNLSDYYIQMASICLNTQKKDSVLYWLTLAHLNGVNSDYSQAAFLIERAKYHKLNKNFTSVITDLYIIESYVLKLSDPEKKVKIYSELSTLWAEAGDNKRSQAFHLLSDNLEDSLANNHRLYAIKAAERVYSLEKKEKDNIILQSKLKYRNSWIIGLSISFLLLLISVFYIYTNQQNRQKKEIAESNLNINKILEEVNQSKIDAWVDGQEKERSRLAAELHDRLGGLLVMASHHFASIEKKFDRIKRENEAAFDEFRKIINNAIIEVRELSKDISSNLVSKLGLSNAMVDLKEKIESATGIKINLNLYNSESRVPLPAEIALFRIAQEAFNNIMKHSQASKVEMSLTGNEISLIMMIEDNGKGFDMEQVHSIGMGLKSMEKRMTDIGGKLVIDSKPGRGTIIVAEVNI